MRAVADAIRWRVAGRVFRKAGLLTTLYFVRHAQSLPLPKQPEPDWRLSPLGAEQAERLVPILRGLRIQRLYCSPFRRCRDTLAPFARASGIEIVPHPGLRERSIAQQWQSDFREFWRRSWEDFSYKLDGGESSQTCR